MPAPSWIRHSEFDQSSWGDRTGALTAEERAFIEGRERAITIAEASDDRMAYEYDDWALCELDGVYYVFETSGCSCPSPSETWWLVKCGGKEEILDFLDAETGQSICFLLRAVEAVGWTLRKPAPVASGSDW